MAKVVVIYAGGFQPFHVGHLSSYLEAKHAFPNADFYVTASDNTSTRPIPFKEKQWLAMQAGVAPQDFTEVAIRSPMNPVEILSQYDPNRDIFILVRSERDPVGYTKKDGSPGYYQPFKSLDKSVPFNPKGGHGYVFVTHKADFNINGQPVYSGTQVRQLYQQANSTGRNRIIKDMYPKSPNQAHIRKILDQYIGQAAEPTPAKVLKTAKPKTSAIKKLKANPLKENLLKVIQTARPMLKEASVEQKLKLMKLLKESLTAISIADLHPADELAHRLKKLSAGQVHYDHIDGIMKELSRKHGLDNAGKKLHNMFISKYGHNPDYWIKKIKNPVTETDVDEGKIINPKMINLYLQLRKPGAKPILVNKNNPIPYKAIDALIDKISSKYNNIYPDMFSFIPADKESVAENNNTDYLPEK
jgi:hypothetical protein